MNRRLYRSVADRRIGGVAAGTATYFDIDPSISRVLWLILALFTGGAFGIVYLVMWAVVPEEPWNPPQPAVPAAGPPAEGSAEGADGGEAAAAGGAALVAEGTPAGEPQWGANPAGTPPAGAPAPTGWSTTVEVGKSGGPGAHVIFGAILVFIGGWLLIQQFFPAINFGMLWPIGLVIVGVIILLAAFRRGT